MKSFLKEFVKEVATLKRPVTAASVAGTVIVLIAPFGLHIGADTLGAALVAIGVVAAFVERVKKPQVR